MLSINFLDISENMHLWNDTIKIYNSSFPEWEREDSYNILKNIKNSRYKMIVSIYKNKVLGFYILDTNQKLNYTLFTFLAVEKTLRGKGIGTQLCLHAIDYFKKKITCQWLLIVTENNLVKFYGKLGFKRIIIDYNVPKFNCVIFV